MSIDNKEVVLAGKKKDAPIRQQKKFLQLQQLMEDFAFLKRANQNHGNLLCRELF